MIEEIIGRKIGMTQIFTEDGKTVPVTAISVGPCWITQKKDYEKCGYSAVQLGIGEKKEKNIEDIAWSCPDALARELRRFVK